MITRGHRTPASEGRRNMAHLPPIRAGVPHRNLSISKLMNFNTKLVGKPLMASSDLLDGVNGDAEAALSGQPVDDRPFEFGGVVDLHATKVEPVSTLVKSY